MNFKIFSFFKKIFFYIQFKSKLLIAQSIYIIISVFKRKKYIKIIRKKTIWNIRLNDILGISIFLTGGFQTNKLNQFSKTIINESMVVDIGANIGSFSIGLCNKNRLVKKIISIEPDIENFKILMNNVKENNLEEKINIYNSYIGFLDQKSLSKYPLISDSKNLNYFNGEAGNFQGIKPFDKKIITSNLNNLKLLLKIDVDGNEASVIQSFSKIISDYKPTILLEINKVLLSDQDLKFIVTFFEKNGYKILTRKKLKKLNTIYSSYKLWGLDVILVQAN